MPFPFFQISCYIQETANKSFLFTGKHWERALLEIPCLNLVRILEPLTLAGHKVSCKKLLSIL